MKVSICNLDVWIDEAPENRREFRQAICLILVAVSQDPKLRSLMVIKGGILMGIRYRSDRYTTDLDFSAIHHREQFDTEGFELALKRSLAMASAASDNGLDCRVQSYRFNPPGDDCQFPNLQIKIGYAYKGSPKHKRLLEGQSPTIIAIDFSFNEPIIDIEQIEIGEGGSLLAYALTDLVAEKFRALMQQLQRNRYRRQDVYDLRFLLDFINHESQKKLIYEAIITKAKARGIDPHLDTLSNIEIKRRAQKEYGTLKDEISGDLPDFDESYDKVESFYRSLPWP